MHRLRTAARHPLTVADLDLRHRRAAGPVDVTLMRVRTAPKYVWTGAGLALEDRVVGFDPVDLGCPKGCLCSSCVADAILADRKAAVDALTAAQANADAARLVAIARADLIDWRRLPESFGYRAEVRNWLDAVCMRLEKLHAAASRVTATLDADRHPVAHGHFRRVGDDAWRERMTWAVLRDDVKRAGR